MVCSPHRYLFEKIATGRANYIGTPRAGYAQPRYQTTYQTRYAQNQEMKTQYAKNIERFLDTTQPYLQKETDDTKFRTKEEWFAPTTPILTQNTTYEPVTFNLEQFIAQDTNSNQQIQINDGVTDQMTKKETTKQELARKIMNELEQFGPREDHEHGPDTHVH